MDIFKNQNSHQPILTERILLISISPYSMSLHSMLVTGVNCWLNNCEYLNSGFFLSYLHGGSLGGKWLWGEPTTAPAALSFI